MAKSAKRNNVLYYAGWFCVWLALGGAVISLSMLYQKKISRGEIMYGAWVELKAPPYDTEVFELSAVGVTQNSRVISTEFRYTGSELSFYRGNAITEYQVVNHDKTLLRRVRPAPSGVYFAKQGSEVYYDRTAVPDNTQTKAIRFRN